jgi:hypothetical protein
MRGRAMVAAPKIEPRLKRVRSAKLALPHHDDAIAKPLEAPPPPRKKTKPTYASKLRRLEGKAKRSGVKTLRSRPGRED